MTQFDPSQLFRLVDVFGVFANGLLGGALARRHRFDVVGFVVLAIVSGLGGGILRDVMLSLRPVALTDPAYLGMALSAALISYLLPLDQRWFNRALVVLDAMAVGSWAATGASKALYLGVEFVPAVLLGTITAIGGGIIRDLLVGRTPQVFGGNPLYASLAVVGAVQMVLFQTAYMPKTGMAASIITTTLLVVIARRRRWHLPGPIDINPAPHFKQYRRQRQNQRRTGSSAARQPSGRKGLRRKRLG